NGNRSARPTSSHQCCPTVPIKIRVIFLKRLLLHYVGTTTYERWGCGFNVFPSRVRAFFLLHPKGRCLMPGKGLAFFVLLIILLATTTPAMAIPSMIFTDRASFDAAVGNTTLLTFDTLPPPTFTPFTFTVNIDDLLLFGGESASFVGYDSSPGSFCFCS